MKLGIYRHYKGQDFLVLMVGRDEPTLEEVVVYQHLYGDYDVWMRLRSEFERDVESTDPPYRGPRFRYLRPFTAKDWEKHPKALWMQPLPTGGAVSSK